MHKFSFKDKFYKYCASGNDFIIFCADKKFDASDLAIRLCNRFSGMGADGLIIILPHQNLDFEWDFYNCDGSKASMCGNGSRAAAHFAHHFLNKKAHLSFLSQAGIIKAFVDKDEVEVLLSRAEKLKDDFKAEDKIWQLCDTGVPHLVHFTQDLGSFDEKLCASLRKKYNANVNFAQIISPQQIKVRTFERGVEGETLACGTGMAACFYLARLQNLVDEKCFIEAKSGELVQMRLVGDELYFKGKVRWCFEANFNFS